MPGRKDVASVANRMAPLGLLQIASYLIRNGHSIMLYDSLGPKTLAPEKAIKKILEFRPDIAGFSVTTSGFYDAYETLEKIKHSNPDIKAVFGGVHVSAMGDVLLKKFPQIDYLVQGEGELSMLELASSRNPSSINGLVWRNGEQTVSNSPREHIEDLDSMPFPAYELLEGFPNGYNLPLFSYIKFPGATMVTSRGCPYECSYCDRSVFKRGFRFNSAAYIYEHMKYLREKFGVRHINIYDDLFTLRRDRIEELCGALSSKPLGVNFNCAVRAGYDDDNLLNMLKRAGCLMVSLGIESGDTDMLVRHKAGIKLEQVRDSVARIKRAGLRAKGLFIMGLPGETEESIAKTSDFAMSLGLDDMNMSKFTPFPGAPVWGSINSEGSFEEDWRRMNCLNFVFVPKSIESKEKLDSLYNIHVKRFYSDKKWRRKFARRLWQHRWSIFYLLRHIPSFVSAKKSFENSFEKYVKK
jgi:magnesium-protoporphyrin IX monomethyl ester (oxidative) cyclase